MGNKLTKKTNKQPKLSPANDNVESGRTEVKQLPGQISGHTKLRQHTDIPINRVIRRQPYSRLNNSPTRGTGHAVLVPEIGQISKQNPVYKSVLVTRRRALECYVCNKSRHTKANEIFQTSTSIEDRENDIEEEEGEYIDSDISKTYLRNGRKVSTNKCNKESAKPCNERPQNHNAFDAGRVELGTRLTVPLFQHTSRSRLPHVTRVNQPVCSTSENMPDKATGKVCVAYGGIKEDNGSENVENTQNYAFSSRLYTPIKHHYIPFNNSSDKHQASALFLQSSNGNPTRPFNSKTGEENNENMEELLNKQKYLFSERSFSNKVVLPQTILSTRRNRKGHVFRRLDSGKDIGTGIYNSLNDKRIRTDNTTNLETTGSKDRSHLYPPCRKLIITGKLRNQRGNYMDNFGKYRTDLNKRNSNQQSSNCSQRKQEKTNPDGSQLQSISFPDVEIYTFNQNSPIMAVSKQTKVENIIGDIRNMLQVCDTSSLTLFRGDKELPCSKDFEHALGSTSYPVRLDVVIHPVERVPEESLRKFNLYDMIDGDLTDDTAVMVQMSCGHATTPENLYDFCLTEIRCKKAEISCFVSGCEKSWDFGEIFRKACLSDSEQHLFEARLSRNAVLLEKNVFSCPSCGLMIDISSARYRLYFRCSYCNSDKFCRKCHLPMSGYTCKTPQCSKHSLAINKTLTECQKKTIVGVPGCPTVRACPKCTQLIQHTGDLCKHMDCLICKSRFCFICLSIKTDYWTCGGAFDTCRVAPIQKV